MKTPRTSAQASVFMGGRDEPGHDGGLGMGSERVKTAREVHPEALDAAFGPGFRLVSLTAIPTHEKPTHGTLMAKFPK